MRNVVHIHVGNALRSIKRVRDAPEWAYRSLFQTLFTNGYLAKLHDAPWILDAGTGSGALSLAFNTAHAEQTLAGNAMFSGIDQSPEMLRIAQCGFDEAGLNAALHNYDICQLPWEQDTFDFAMAAHVIEHIPSPENALHELVRVLQPGAPLLLVLTKKSFLGALVQMNWRVHSIGHRALSVMLKIQGKNSSLAKVKVPSEASGQSIHIVLEVEDDGSPHLTAYRRMIINVQ